MKLMDVETNKEYAPIWIDSNNNLVVTTELAYSDLNGVIVMHPCGIGSMFKKLLSTKKPEDIKSHDIP